MWLLFSRNCGKCLLFCMFVSGAFLVQHAQHNKLWISHILFPVTTDLNELLSPLIIYQTQFCVSQH